MNDSLTYYFYGAFDESPDGKYWHMCGFKDRVGSMDNFKKVDDRTFLVNIKPEHAYSSVVWRTLTKSYLINAQRHLATIETQYSWIPDFPNV